MTIVLPGPIFFASLIAKLIVHAPDRDQCILKLKQALKEIVIEPISTTIDLHKEILESLSFWEVSRKMVSAMFT